MRSKLLTLAAVLVLGAGIAACGEDDEPAASGEEAATPAATEAPEPANVDAIVAGIAKNTRRKPEIVAPEGDPPTELIVRDIVEGKGRAAKPGDQLTMQYVGVSWSTGEQFDASWDRGQGFPFQLGAGMVIPGWDQGMEGMKEGGRRLLIIPPDLGYGAAGAGGTIGPNETLVFAVDLEQLG